MLGSPSTEVRKYWLRANYHCLFFFFFFTGDKASVTRPFDMKNISKFEKLVKCKKRKKKKKKLESKGGPCPKTPGRFDTD